MWVCGNRTKIEFLSCVGGSKHEREAKSCWHVSSATPHPPLGICNHPRRLPRVANHGRKKKEPQKQLAIIGQSHRRSLLIHDRDQAGCRSRSASSARYLQILPHSLPLLMISNHSAPLASIHGSSRNHTIVPADGSIVMVTWSERERKSRTGG
ncbi:uncharacterized protein BO97DRAFT_252787 [Aspergillus homomorphus CBS 101889]|uniref:Uncharacterized protein n=1 Tax=Aspergillus homomorphus (strain CBS 101889) TaxID=1450537 RepID=A0A395HHI8_ASPHC|nr:hypothetical protein BO97DRAFT_252787 [Aspergillus homomorphus CBS 101889]RAL07382.1 hypothetical protein BO97DRAFT_252787 [Aspergillus homomorphus CBS 101889]